MYGTFLRRVGPLIFFTVIALLAPSAGSAGGSGASSPPPPQPPPIPLNLSNYAICTRTPPSSWTADENYDLSLAYNQERWSHVQEKIRSFLATLQCTPELPKDAYYSVVFLNEALGTPALSRVLVHDPEPGPEIYGNRVGRYDLYDLQLLPDFGILVSTVYQAGTVPNGVLAQLPGFLAKAANATASVPPPPSSSPAQAVIIPVAAIPAKTKLSAGEIARLRSIPRLGRASFIIRRVNSPWEFKRGGLRTASVVPQVTATDQLSFSPSLVKYLTDSLAQRAAHADQDFQSWSCKDVGCFENSSGKGPLTFFNEQLKAAYEACQNPPSPPACPPSAKATADITCASAAGPSANATTPCPLGIDDYLLLASGLASSQKFVTSLAELGTTYTALATFSNSGAQPGIPPLATQYTFGKLTRWAYSLGIGVIGGISHSEPATVTDGSFTRVSPSSSLAFVAADYHPFPYDETTFSPTWQERLRAFGGVAVSTDKGAVFGVGTSLFRGLTLEGGFAFLLTDVLPRGASFQTAMSSTTPSSKDMTSQTMSAKTKRDYYRAPFIAIGYSFQ